MLQCLTLHQAKGYLPQHHTVWPISDVWWELARVVTWQWQTVETRDIGHKSQHLNTSIWCHNSSNIYSNMIPVGWWTAGRNKLLVSVGVKPIRTNLVRRNCFWTEGHTSTPVSLKSYVVFIKLFRCFISQEQYHSKQRSRHNYTAR